MESADKFVVVCGTVMAIAGAQLTWGMSGALMMGGLIVVLTIITRR